MRIKIFLLILSLTGFLTIQGCYDAFNCESARGNVVSEEIVLDTFDAISFDEAGNVYLRQDSIQQVVVESNQNIISNLNRNVQDGIWNIRFNECFNRYDKFDVFISVKDLNSIVLAGSGNILGDGAFETSDMYISLLGSGNITMEVYSETMNGDISGSGNISLWGQTEVSEYFISGSGNIMALNLESDICEVSISGSGNCDVFVNDELDVRISGSGSVRYKGNPAVNSTITGSGAIVPIN